jgi:hypothetical protein
LIGFTEGLVVFSFPFMDVDYFANVAPDPTAVSDPIFRYLREIESAKCYQICGRDALCLRAIRKWKVRFRAGQEGNKDDERSAGLPQTDICNIILHFLKKNSPFHLEISTRIFLFQERQFSDY